MHSSAGSAAARAGECGAHREQGFATTADWLARVSGSSTGAAKTALDLRLRSIEPEDLHRLQHDAMQFRYWTTALGNIGFAGEVPPELGIPIINLVTAGRVVDTGAPGCDRRQGLQMDHADPVANGGLTSFGNLAPLCIPHHWAKTEEDRKAGRLRRCSAPP